MRGLCLLGLALRLRANPSRLIGYKREGLGSRFRGLGLDRLQRRFLAEGAPEASAGVSSLYRSGCGLAVVKVRLATGAKNLRKRSKKKSSSKAASVLLWLALISRPSFPSFTAHPAGRSHSAASCFACELATLKDSALSLPLPLPFLFHDPTIHEGILLQGQGMHLRLTRRERL